MKRHLSLAFFITSTATVGLCLFSLYVASSETRDRFLIAMLGAGLAFSAVANVEHLLVRRARTSGVASLRRFLPLGGLALGAFALLSVASVGLFNSSLVAVGARESVLLAVTVAASLCAFKSAWLLGGVNGNHRR